LKIYYSRLISKTVRS